MIYFIFLILKILLIFREQNYFVQCSNFPNNAISFVHVIRITFVSLFLNVFNPADLAFRGKFKYANIRDLELVRALLEGLIIFYETQV